MGLVGNLVNTPWVDASGFTRWHHPSVEDVGNGERACLLLPESMS